MTDFQQIKKTLLSLNKMIHAILPWIIISSIIILGLSIMTKSLIIIIIGVIYTFFSIFLISGIAMTVGEIKQRHENK